MSLTKDGFYKQIGGAIGNNNYVLLAGGGHKALSDFSLVGHEHNYLKHLAKTEDECIPNVYDAFQSFRCTII